LSVYATVRLIPIANSRAASLALRKIRVPSARTMQSA
jgi:hypothetical protein